MSDNKGQRLVRSRGPVFGHAISSYRAEAFRMLSFHRFLLIRLQETQMESDQPMKAPHLVCDNQGLITSQDKHAQYTNIFPNTTIEAEWDVLAQLLESIKSLGHLAPTTDHIKGHQDDDTPYEQLPLLAQLNCDADAHASAYLRDNPTTDYTSSHVFPAGECILQLHHGTVTRDIKHACAEAQTLPLL